MAAMTRVGVKDNVKMMESRAEIDAGQSHLSKCEAGEDSCGKGEKNIYKNCEIVLRLSSEAEKKKENRA